jgi:hypothetical protein
MQAFRQVYACGAVQAVGALQEVTRNKDRRGCGSGYCKARKLVERKSKHLGGTVQTVSRFLYFKDGSGRSSMLHLAVRDTGTRANRYRRLSPNRSSRHDLLSQTPGLDYSHLYTQHRDTTQSLHAPSSSRRLSVDEQ